MEAGTPRNFLLAFGSLSLVVFLLVSYGLLVALLLRERQRRILTQRRRRRREIRLEEAARRAENEPTSIEIDVIAPELVYVTIEDAESDEVEKPSEKETVCAVCLDELEDGQLMRSLPCHHTFHSECIKVWLKRCQRCPLCNLSMERKGLEELTNQLSAEICE